MDLKNSNLVCVYKDKNNNLLIIPTVRDKDGVTRDFNKPFYFSPIEPRIIGERLKNAFEVSMNEKINNRDDIVKVFEVVTGIKSYSKFSRERLLIWAETDGELIMLTPCLRENDGSYSPNRTKTKGFKSIIDNFELGTKILNIFEEIKSEPIS